MTVSVLYTSLARTLFNDADEQRPFWVLSGWSAFDGREVLRKVSTLAEDDEFVYINGRDMTPDAVPDLQATGGQGRLTDIEPGSPQALLLAWATHSENKTRFLLVEYIEKIWGDPFVALLQAGSQQLDGHRYRRLVATSQQSLGALLASHDSRRLESTVFKEMGEKHVDPWNDEEENAAWMRQLVNKALVKPEGTQEYTTMEDHNPELAQMVSRVIAEVADGHPLLVRHAISALPTGERDLINTHALKTELLENALPAKAGPILETKRDELMDERTTEEIRKILTRKSEGIKSVPEATKQRLRYYGFLRWHRDKEGWVIPGEFLAKLLKTWVEPAPEGAPNSRPRRAQQELPTCAVVQYDTSGESPVLWLAKAGDEKVPLRCKRKDHEVFVAFADRSPQQIPVREIAAKLERTEVAIRKSINRINGDARELGCGQILRSLPGSTGYRAMLAEIDEGNANS